MFQDPVVVKPPDDQMEMLASSSGKPSTNDSRRSRSGGVNQDPQQALKCPRCDSSNTKFCYFNNYSLTQPRHFCKNCRRYWTNGGALRNVPVGGGCRKNKRVKQRLLGGVDPTSLEESTSNMLARLSNTYVPSFGGPGSFGDDSGQLLNIAFSRFQEAMRLRQQQSSENPAGTQPDDFHASFFDVGFPALMNKTCASGACGGACTCGGLNGTCNGGLMGTSENNLNISMGYNTLPVKLEHDGISYNPTNYELNTFFDQTRHLHMTSTSATATLESIADQLSNFSNVSVVDSFNPDSNLPQLKAQEQKNIPLQQQQQQLAEQKVPLQLLNHAGSHHSSNQGGHNITDFPNHEPEQKVVMEGKPLINVNGLSLMPPDNWQQSPLMNDMFFEPHHNLWNHSRWQDMHALASTTAAGRVL